ncbi:MAG: hypothetical protein GY788_08510 [bacterium]|nr:hypothetical protein [bacterium]
MAKHHGPVLVDTNAIVECHRVGAWRGLVGGYRVETVEACVIETQTGFQRRREEEQIDQKTLEDSLAAVHTVDDLARAAVLVKAPDIRLDRGELDLWAHALNREDNAWVLCGPDKASMRFGVHLGYRERLAALERLLADVGHPGARQLKRAYTSAWLADVLGELALIEAPR